jgi:AraC-like DNA-binding protein
MATEHELRTLYRSETVFIGDYRCRPRCPDRAGEEFSTTHDIGLVRGGVFVRHNSRRRNVTIDANQAIFFNRHEPYAVSHPLPGGDDCTVLTVAPDTLREMLERLDPSARERPERPFAFASAPSPPASFVFHHRLRQCVRSSSIDPLEVDELSLVLVDAVLRAAMRHHGRSVPRSRPDTTRAHAELADAARVAIAAAFDGPLTLDAIARAVHSSPFHLARVFRRHSGLSLHGYQTRLRLRAALERLAEGTRDLTALALQLGFSSHGHFTSTFHAECGVTPSAFRQTATSSGLRELSRNLEV